VIEQITDQNYKIILP